MLVWNTLGRYDDSGYDGITQPSGARDDGTDQPAYYTVRETVRCGDVGIPVLPHTRCTVVGVGGWWPDSVERAVVAW